MVVYAVERVAKNPSWTFVRYQGGEAAAKRLRDLGSGNTVMKLYRVLELHFRQYKSPVDPGPDTIAQLPDSELQALSPYGDTFMMLKDLGYTDMQAGKAIALWCQQQMSSTGCSKWTAMQWCKSYTMDYHDAMTTPLIPPYIIYPVVVVGLVVLAAVLLNPTIELDREVDAPDRMYLMTYKEKAWAAELLGVTYYQKAYYERCMNFGPKIVGLAKNLPLVPDVADRVYWLGSVVTGGWKFPWYYRYAWTFWWCHFCGYVTKISDYKYTLNSGGNDPFLPNGPWWRPGGDYATPQYEGIYKDWPWLGM